MCKFLNTSVHLCFIGSLLEKNKNAKTKRKQRKVHDTFILIPTFRPQTFTWRAHSCPLMSHKTGNFWQLFKLVTHIPFRFALSIALIIRLLLRHLHLPHPAEGTRFRHLGVPESPLKCANRTLRKLSEIIKPRKYLLCTILNKANTRSVRPSCVLRVVTPP